MMELNVAIEMAGNMLEKYGYDHTKDTTGRVIANISTLAAAIIVAAAIDELVIAMRETGTVPEIEEQLDRRR
jgi:putative aminopeptidase FrvX